MKTTIAFFASLVGGFTSGVMSLAKIHATDFSHAITYIIVCGIALLASVIILAVEDLRN